MVKKARRRRQVGALSTPMQADPPSSVITALRPENSLHHRKASTAVSIPEINMASGSSGHRPFRSAALYADGTERACSRLRRFR